jgi:hypothetical protein
MGRPLYNFLLKKSKISQQSYSLSLPCYYFCRKKQQARNTNIFLTNEANEVPDKKKQKKTRKLQPLIEKKVEVC